jgi:phosphohistidine phosphatase SixA
MKIYLIHHTTAFSAEEDPERHLKPQGRDEADRLGNRLRDAGSAPLKILHSDKQWVRETAERLAVVLGMSDRTETAGYPINTGDDITPFLDEIRNCDGDIMMVGHVEYLIRTASALVSGDQNNHVVAFKPGFGSIFCIEGEGDDWVVRFGWLQEHHAG